LLLSFDQVSIQYYHQDVNDHEKNDKVHIEMTIHLMDFHNDLMMDIMLAMMQVY